MIPSIVCKQVDRTIRNRKGRSKVFDRSKFMNANPKPLHTFFIWVMFLSRFIFSARAVLFFFLLLNSDNNNPTNLQRVQQQPLNRLLESTQITQINNHNTTMPDQAIT